MSKPLRSFELKKYHCFAQPPIMACKPLVIQTCFPLSLMFFDICAPSTVERNLTLVSPHFYAMKIPWLLFCSFALSNLYSSTLWWRCVTALSCLCACDSWLGGNAAHRAYSYYHYLFVFKSCYSIVTSHASPWTPWIVFVLVIASYHSSVLPFYSFSVYQCLHFLQQFLSICRSLFSFISTPLLSFLLLSSNISSTCHSSYHMFRRIVPSSRYW